MRMVGSFDCIRAGTVMGIERSSLRTRALLYVRQSILCVAISLSSISFTVYLSLRPGCLLGLTGYSLDREQREATLSQLIKDSHL